MSNSYIARIALSFVGGFILGIVAIWLWDATTIDDSLGQLPDGNGTSLEGTGAQQNGIAGSPIDEDATPATNTEILVRDQESGSEVTIAEVSIPADGWIVVHEERLGVIGNALGAARRDAGDYKTIMVPLLRPTTAGSQYWIVMYRDNGDRLFDLANDFPIRDGVGNPLVASFKAI